MASRRDQLQSYQFRSQRVVSAFVMRETDPAQSPLRRGGGAMLIGGMVTVLVAAAFGVYGILTKTGGNSWKVDGTVVVEKESGATFVYAEGALHPTLNFASALLAAGHAPPVIKSVAANSLGDMPRTAPVGIAGAPNSVPDAKHLTGMPWTVCSVQNRSGNGGGATVVQLTAGRPASGTKALPADDGILATDSSGALALIWHGYRYRVEKAVLSSLFAAAPSTPIGSALLESLPAGADIKDIQVPNAGAKSTAVPNHNNGEVLVAQTGSGPLYYLVFDDGLAPLTELQKDIAVKAGGNPVQVDLGNADKARRSNALPAVTGPQAPPLKPPHLTAPAAGDQVCLEYGESGTAAVSLGPAGDLEGVPTRGRTASGGALADLVAVPSGKAALVVSEPTPGFPIGGWSLVTDTGIRFPVASRDDVSFLGYNPDAASRVPAALLVRIPAGPALNRGAASAAAPLNAK